MKITKTKLKDIIREELNNVLLEDDGNPRPPRADQFAKQLFEMDRQKLLAFYQEVVSPWSRKSFTGDSKKPFIKGLQKYAPWLAKSGRMFAGDPEERKLMSDDDVRFYMRAFHEDVVNLYGAAIKKEQEGSQARQKLLIEFQKILEETAGIQASYIVNVLEIPEFDYLKDRTGPGGDNKTLGGYMNEATLKKIIFEELKRLLG